jgi:hypothetical protein
MLTGRGAQRQLRALIEIVPPFTTLCRRGPHFGVLQSIEGSQMFTRPTFPSL